MKRKDTLIIIGNGFDRWQGLDTSYASFRQFYLKNRDNILKQLDLSEITFGKKSGRSRKLSDVELIYGNPFGADELEEGFWNIFEASLGMVDAQRLNLYFDKNDEGLDNMEKCAENARRILALAFQQWIRSIEIRDDDSFLTFRKDHGLENFAFPENCYFINFNYTDTLEKRFHVDEDDVFHIHGRYDDDEELVFGHAIHPQEPQHELRQFGGRFRGLSVIETLLYYTDKHVQNHIQECRFDLAVSGISAGDIRHIYVLGHSLGEADLEYFDFLAGATTEGRGDAYKDFFKDKVYYDCSDWSMKKVKRLLRKGDSLDDMHNRFQYTLKQYGYRVFGNGYQNYGYAYDEPVLAEELAAVNKKYGIEQTLSNAQMEEEFWTMLQDEFDGSSGASGRISRGSRIVDFFRDVLKKRKKRIERKEPPMWHISCFSEGDRVWAEKVMKGLGCTNYKLYAAIDECLKEVGDYSC